MKRGNLCLFLISVLVISGSLVSAENYVEIKNINLEDGTLDIFIDSSDN